MDLKSFGGVDIVSFPPPSVQIDVLRAHSAGFDPEVSCVTFFDPLLDFWTSPRFLRPVIGRFMDDLDFYFS